MSAVAGLAAADLAGWTQGAYSALISFSFGVAPGVVFYLAARWAPMAVRVPLVACGCTELGPARALPGGR